MLQFGNSIAQLVLLLLESTRERHKDTTMVINLSMTTHHW